MILKASTVVYVTSEEGTSRMTLQGVIHAVNGGMNLDKVQMATDSYESAQLEMRRAARADAIAKVDAMTNVELAAHALQNGLVTDKEQAAELSRLLEKFNLTKATH